MIYCVEIGTDPTALTMKKDVSASLLRLEIKPGQLILLISDSTPYMVKLRKKLRMM